LQRSSRNGLRPTDRISSGRCVFSCMIGDQCLEGAGRQCGQLDTCFNHQGTHRETLSEMRRRFHDSHVGTLLVHFLQQETNCSEFCDFHIISDELCHGRKVRPHPHNSDCSHEIPMKVRRGTMTKIHIQRVTFWPKNGVKDSRRNLLLDLLLATRQTSAKSVWFDSPREAPPQNTRPPAIRRHDPAHFPDLIRRLSAFLAPGQPKTNLSLIVMVEPSADSTGRWNSVEMNLGGLSSGWPGRWHHLRCFPPIFWCLTDCFAFQNLIDMNNQSRGLRRKIFFR
jgi:hypothetical protein